MSLKDEKQGYLTSNCGSEKKRKNFYKIYLTLAFYFKRNIISFYRENLSLVYIIQIIIYLMIYFRAFTRCLKWKIYSHVGYP